MAGSNGTKPARARRRGVPSGAPADASTIEAALRREIQIANDNLGLLAARLEESAGDSPFASTREGVADLERAVIADPGWRLFTTLAQQEFSEDGRRQLRAVCRLMAIANPLIKRGLNLRAHYVWGQGCEIIARADGKKDGEQDVQTVVAAFLTDQANQRAVFGQQARGELERALGTDGEVYVALFTRPASGWTQARTITADEITEIITDPDDAATPWFYRRVWVRQTYDERGTLQQETQEALYPDVDHKPRSKPRSFAGVEIKWDAPVVALQVNRPLGWLRGIPDAYAAIAWARAYKEFLEQWAGLMKSLARFAWKLSAEGKNREQAKARMAVAAAGNTSTTPGERTDVGAAAILPPNVGLEAIPKTGATIDAESGRPLAMQVAAALDVPVTMLLADPGQTGARATAETLDWPTELAMTDRRSLWSAFQARIVAHVITEAARAPRGPLKGSVKRDPVTDREVLTLAGDTDDTVDVIWPDLDGTDPKAAIEAVVAAAGTGTVPPEIILRHLLQALGVRELDSVLADMVDEHGAFKWPQAAPIGAGGQAAALARAGGDPATAGEPGRMGPDGQPIPGAPGEPGQPGALPEVPGVSAEALARQADADFGLFGGRGADDQAEPDQAGTEPAEPDQAGPRPADIFDPEFFRI